MTDIVVTALASRGGGVDGGVAKYLGEVVSPEDMVHSPKHYADRVPGIECIEVTQHFPFNLGNVIKYVWRCGYKGDPIEDLEKARTYLDFEIARLGGKPSDPMAKHVSTKASPLESELQSYLFPMENAA